MVFIFYFFSMQTKKENHYFTIIIDNDSGINTLIQGIGGLDNFIVMAI